MTTFLDHDSPETNSTFAAVLTPMIGQVCWRFALRSNRSISVGFGPEVRHRDRVYGAWEVGNYAGAWRVVRGSTIVVASNDAVDSLEELESRLAVLRGKSFRRLLRVSRSDVAVVLDHDFSIELLATTSEDDETFHLFAPGHMFIGYSVRRAWECAPSNAPMPDDR